MSTLNSYGSYLIRESESKPGNYSLSVRDRDDVEHYRIWHLDNGEFYVIPRIKFYTLQDLVIHYQQDADGLCVNLKKPCAFPDMSQTAGHSRQVIDEWQINRSEVSLKKKVMSSVFIDVWEGIWNNTTVAVKTLKPQEIVSADDFLQAGYLLTKLHHPNLVRLLALCSREEPVLIITEFMKHNSLLEYLRGEGRSLKLPQLIDMASQVAAGMAYLEEQNAIHRDLAARNIMVGEDLICKVGNFEMARMIDEDIYEAQNGEKIAIKWAAPESILYNRCSIKSDVWSFGIVLYEIITFGRFPYLNITNVEVKQRIQQGYRMPRPMGCPDELYDIMLNCWQEEPANRPTFETLLFQLEEFFTL